MEKPIVLAVDDTPENLDVVKNILSDEYTVKAAPNGKIAIKIAETQPVDIILLDIMMPEIDGYQVCEHLKSNPETAHIPIIFLTAKDQTADETKGFDLGAADYILKPVSAPILEARVRTHVTLKKSRDELTSAYELIDDQRRRMQEELNVGRKIQLDMVPGNFPAFPDREDIDIFAVLRPAREIGGDFYDFFQRSQDEICICVADVSGKGVPAALFMAVTKTLLKSRAMEDSSTASIVTRVNEEISKDNPNFMFVTVFFAILNTKTGTLKYTNAGHNPSFIRRGNELIKLSSLHGPVVGAMEDFAYGEEEVALTEGDIVVGYTDGITEAINSEQELFEEERLCETLLANHTSLETLVNSTVAAVDAYAGEQEQFDDITLLAVGFESKPDSTGDKNFEIKIANRSDEVTRAIDEFSEFAEANTLPSNVTNVINMVFDELLTNIVSYGYGDDSAERYIDIEVDYRPEHLALIISDDALPFNPLAQAQPDVGAGLEDRDIGGLGIHLVRSMVDDITYARRKNRNILTLTKKI